MGRLASLLFLAQACGAPASSLPASEDAAGEASPAEGEGEGEGEGEAPAKPPVAGPRRCVDVDLDTYGEGCDPGPDCNDADPRVHPAGLEVCNGVDDDCDVAVDESDPLLGADCEVDAAGCAWPGRFACVDGARVCHAGRVVTAGLHPHVASMPVGWGLAWLGPGADDSRVMQAFTAPLTDDGELGAVGVQLTRSVSLSSGPPVSLPAEGRVEALYLGSPGRGSLEVHLMHARRPDESPTSLAALAPTPTFPESWRPSVAGRAVAWWDGRSDPGGVRWQALDGEAVTAAGGAASWPHLAAEGDGYRLTFVRAPGEIRTLAVDAEGSASGAEELVASDEGALRPAQAAGVWVWLQREGAVRMLQEGSGRGPQTVDPFGDPAFDPAALGLEGRALIAWTRTTFDGPEIVAWSPASEGGARALGPGAGPVVARRGDAVAAVFDRGGLVHFASAACP